MSNSKTASPDTVHPATAGPGTSPEDQTLNTSPMALVKEARRISEDLCLHWETCGDEHGVSEVVPGLSEALVADIYVLADGVEEAWKQALKEGQDGGARATHTATIALPAGLTTYAQRLMERLDESLRQLLGAVEPIPDDVRAPYDVDTGSVARLGALVEVLQQRLHLADTHREALLRADLIEQRWLEQGAESCYLLDRWLLATGEDGEVAERLHTLALRLQSLLEEARRAASQYSLRVGFTKQEQRESRVEVDGQ